MRDYAALAREKVQQEKVRLSHHAQQERLDENISTEDIVIALKNGREVEVYPDDPRGPSALLAGQDTQERWIHLVCGNFDHEYLLVITVYLPQPPKWIDPFTRGR